MKNFIEYCRFFNKGLWAAGIDIKKAYRNTYIRKEDWPLLGYSIAGLWFVDCRGTQGVSSMGNYV